MLLISLHNSRPRLYINLLFTKQSVGSRVYSENKRRSLSQVPRASRCGRKASSALERCLAIKRSVWAIFCVSFSWLDSWLIRVTCTSKTVTPTCSGQPGLLPVMGWRMETVWAGNQCLTYGLIFLVPCPSGIKSLASLFERVKPFASAIITNAECLLTVFVLL